VKAEIGIADVSEESIVNLAIDTLGRSKQALVLFQQNQAQRQLLKNSKIIRDIEQDALTRVSLRSIRDFAVPLEVTLGDQKEIFWKWYMISDEEATELIRNYLKVMEKKCLPKEVKQRAPEKHPREPREQSLSH
jgi:hypothetical protein